MEMPVKGVQDEDLLSAHPQIMRCYPDTRTLTAAAHAQHGDVW